MNVSIGAMRRAEANTSIEEISDQLSYCRETGEFRWRTNSPGKRRGEIAGATVDGGYRAIKVFGRMFRAHRLAWAIHHNEWPSDEIDHIDRNRANNAISNLRQATRQENALNVGRSKANKSGHKGVSWLRAQGVFVASITIKKKSVFLGRFKTAEAAGAAYREAEIANFGEFARKEG